MHRILVVHNAYQQKGGEDSVVDSEIALLRAHGHEVLEYRRSNDDLNHMGRLPAAAQTLWSTRTTADLSRLFATSRPDVMHVHNTFPLISPSLYWAAARARVPVVQTLHNYRLICPQAMLLRDGRICEDCVGKLPWRGACRGCYRESRPQSAVLAAMLSLHRGLGSYSRHVDRYIALTASGRDKLVAGGLPGERIRIKPNFVKAPAALPEHPRRQHALFVGRLSPEKGLATLRDALIRCPEIDVRIAGEGPGAETLSCLPNAIRLGWQTGEAVRQQMQEAFALVLPSIWLEPFGLVMIEAFANGLPVIASRRGAPADIIEDGQTGLLFEPGNAEDLAAKLRWAAAQPETMAEMGRRARSVYEANYTPESNYALLMEIYREAAAAVQ